jgi:hypothetical protein
MPYLPTGATFAATIARAPADDPLDANREDNLMVDLIDRMMRWVRKGLPVLATLTVILTWTLSPARAGFGDCVDALTESAELAKYLAEQAGKIGVCADKLGANPPVTAAVGALVALTYAAGQFDDEATCQGLVNTTIALMLTKLIEQSPALQDAMKGLLGESNYTEFMKQASAGAGDQIANLPGISQIFGLMQCSCTVLGTGIGTAQQVREIVADTASCAQSGVAQVGVAGEWLHCNVFSKNCNLQPGPQMPQCGAVYAVCSPGEDFAACMARDKLLRGDMYAQSGCGPTYVCPGAPPSGKPWQGGADPVKIGGRDYCACPSGQGFDYAKAVDTKAGNEACITCSGPGKVLKTMSNNKGVDYCQSWTCAESKPGLKLASYGNDIGKCNYEPVCAGGKIWNDAKKSCDYCPTNSVFSGYSSPGGLTTGGTCRECAFDEYTTLGPSGSKQCLKLACKGTDHPAKDKPHQCVPCKTVFNPNGKALGGGLAAQFGDKPVCLDQIAMTETCKPGTIPFPDGQCHIPPAGVRVGTTVARQKVPPKIGPAPIERQRIVNVRNAPATKAVTQPAAPAAPKAKSIAPDLDLGDAPGGGFTQPGAFGNRRGTVR